MTTPRTSSNGIPPSESATKSRIITHMNADHQPSLTRYLEHYNKLSPYSARNAHLTDISLTYLIISTSPKTASSIPSVTSSPPLKSHVTGHRHYIPLDPPLSSYSEFRQRLVDMDKLCVEKLGRSDITVKTWVPAHGYRAFITVLVVCTFILFSTGANVDPGRDGWLFKKGLKQTVVPGFWVFLKRVRGLVLLLIFGAHTGEAYYMATSKLPKYNVPQYSTLWWKWVLSTFMDGFGNFLDFDSVVKEERRKKEKVKH